MAGKLAIFLVLPLSMLFCLGCHSEGGLLEVIMFWFPIACVGCAVGVARFEEQRERRGARRRAGVHVPQGTQPTLEARLAAVTRDLDAKAEAAAAEASVAQRRGSVGEVEGSLQEVDREESLKSEPGLMVKAEPLVPQSGVWLCNHHCGFKGSFEIVQEHEAHCTFRLVHSEPDGKPQPEPEPVMHVDDARP